ncbi:hypothetical protein MLD38_034327 [Melastoma candidum]|uniref:Uncharacterized protein n=1 Tax=Melastoma candidum TaxID=119954 RepID=A0ACB9MBF6_9MYRT|nr:hypothetical protein MLD38_034327 [Melastoma candidum]
MASEKPIAGKSPSIPEQQNPLRTVNFPTVLSPVATNLGEVIVHFSQLQQHPLAHINSSEMFTCSGCCENGVGKRYACRICNHQLHDFCALAPKALAAHPLHCQHRLLFYSKPATKGAMVKSKCDACGKSIKGYNFRCNACNFQIHPCCAMLPTELNFSSHPHALKLLPANAMLSGDAGFACGECKKKKPGRVYRCTACKYHLHAVCAKSIFNGLHDLGIEEVDKPSILGTAGRVAVLVIKDLVGGVVEGIGQGLGNDIVQNLINGGGFKSVTLDDSIGHHGRN